MTSASHQGPNAIPDLPNTVSGLDKEDSLYFQNKIAEAHKVYQAVLDQIAVSQKDNAQEIITLYRKWDLPSSKLVKFSDANNFVNKAHEFVKGREDENSLLELASILYAIGETFTLEAKYNEAEEYLTISIKIITENYGEEHKELATAYNKLGLLYYSQKRAPEALECVEKALKICLLQNNEGDELSTSYFYLAKVYSYLDEIDKASDYAQKSLQIASQVYGENHVQIALRYSMFGNIEKAKKSRFQALKYYEQSQQMLITLLEKSNDNRLELATCYYEVGDTKCRLNNYEEALVNYEKALEIQEKILPDDHPDRGYTYAGIALAFQQNGPTEHALHFYEKAVNIFERKFGETFSEIAAYLENMADLYWNDSRFSHSTRMMEKCLAIELKKKDPNAPRVAHIHLGIGFFYLEEKKYRNALKSFLQSDKIYNSLAERRFSDENSCFYNMSNTLKLNGDIKSGENMFKKSFMCLKKADDDDINHAMETLKTMEKRRHLLDINYNLTF